MDNGLGARTSEVQWKSAKKRRDNIYKSYINLLFDLIKKNTIHVHIRFAPANGKSNKPEDISKAFYQLLLHRAGRYYSADAKIRVRPDNGCCTEYLPKMLVGLNNDIHRKHGKPNNSIADIVPGDSRNEHLLQLLDVTLGALTSLRNNNHLSGGIGPFKIALADHTLACAPITNIAANSPITQNSFNIWNVMPSSTVPKR